MPRRCRPRAARAACLAPLPNEATRGALWFQLRLPQQSHPATHQIRVLLVEQGEHPTSGRLRQRTLPKASPSPTPSTVPDPTPTADAPPAAKRSEPRLIAARSTGLPVQLKFRQCTERNTHITNVRPQIRLTIHAHTARAHHRHAARGSLVSLRERTFATSTRSAHAAPPRRQSPRQRRRTG